MRRSDSIEHVGKEIDELIEAGWDVLDTYFEPAAIEHWRKKVSRVRILLNSEKKD